jgi:SNF2 family DNA or RNA helicase
MTKLLDVLEDFLHGIMTSGGRHPLFYRLDGETPTSERHRLIDDFNRPDCPVQILPVSFISIFTLFFLYNLYYIYIY